MRKRALVFVSVALLMGIFAAGAYAVNPVRLLVNGHEVSSDVPPQIIEGRTMVPIRWVAEALGAEVRWDDDSNTVYIDKPYFVSSNPEAGAKLYPFQEINGMYEGFILEINEERKYFNWKNTSNPSFIPQILFNDINQDGNKELIIILTTGTGTGVHTEDIYVLNPATLEEIEVERPADIVKNNLDTRIESDGDRMAIHIVTGDEKTTVYKDRKYAATWFDKVIFSNSYHYEVINNELLLKMGAQVSPAGFIGEIVVTYTFEDGRYRLKTIKYDHEDNRNRDVTNTTSRQLSLEPPTIMQYRLP